jgi:hypothetical protein
MKSKLVYIIHILLVVLVAWGLGFSQAKGQEGSPPAGPSAVTSILSSAFTYQGVLKENGVPVTGNRDMTFKLLEFCGGDGPPPIGPISIAVKNGLFSTTLDFTGQADYIDGSTYWLEVWVGGVKISCQELLPVPYALSLRPGAHISFEVPGEAALNIVNRSNAVGSVGLSVQSWGGPSVAIYAAGPIKSSSDSSLVLSPHSMVVRDGSPSMLLTPQGDGSMKIETSVDQDVYISLPVSTFGTLFGTQVSIKSIDVCYKVGSASTLILATQVVKRASAFPYYDLYIDDQPPGGRNSSSVTCYNAVASTIKGIGDSTWVQFTLSFPGGGVNTVYIYTVKLTLGE